MSYQQQHMTDNSNKRICSECKKSEYEQEVIGLTTFGGRDRNLVNLDGSPHTNFYSRQKWERKHYGKTSLH